MAIVKQRLHKKTTSGHYDIIHLETSADLLVGAVPIANGGTGATTAAAARAALQALYDDYPSRTSYKNVDFNTITTNGVYRMLYNDGTDQTPYHTPYAQYTSGYKTVTHYNLLVMGMPTRLTQIAISAYSHNDDAVFVRNKHDDTWSSWRRFYTDAQTIPVANGGTGATSAAAARTNLGAAATSHTHTIAQVTNLQNTLNGKAPVSHTHTTSQITGLQAYIESLIGSATGSGGGIPAGVICMWSGAANSIPSGWALCNGSNGTPDLRDRFIVGAGNTYSPGNIGGSESVALTTNQMPVHSHELSLSGLRTSPASSSSGGGGYFYVRTASYAGGPSSSGSTLLIQGMVGADNSGTTASPSIINISGGGGGGGSHTHSVYGSGSINNTGGGQAHENRPPYYALCFIMKLADDGSAAPSAPISFTQQVSGSVRYGESESASKATVSLRDTCTYIIAKDTKSSTQARVERNGTAAFKTVLNVNSTAVLMKLSLSSDGRDLTIWLDPYKASGDSSTMGLAYDFTINGYE